MVDVHNAKVLTTSQYYSTGATTMFASEIDQRFSYCLYVPGTQTADPDRYPLVVIQHGTGRTAEAYRDAMAGFCEEHRVVVLAPLFPAAIDDPDDLHNFKFIEYHGIRFDKILLAIVDEVGRKFRVRTDRFLLHGFSGGGQFAHRFLYLHPDRLLGVSIGAPGRVTLLDPDEPWWLGTQGFDERFGRMPDIEAIRKVPILLVAGERDVETWETNNRDDPSWMDGLERQGSTRVERIGLLHRNLTKNGISSQLELVEGIAHDGVAALPTVQRFFASILSGAAPDRDATLL